MKADQTYNSVRWNYVLGCASFLSYAVAASPGNNNVQIPFLNAQSKTTLEQIPSETVSIDCSSKLTRFDGLGAISGGGATSKLLNTYKQPYTDQLYDLLFKPGYAASLHILKVEIGGDGDSTDGSEASHEHTPDDLNYHRGYEWKILQEAQNRNPTITLIGLPWTFPGWLSGGNRNPFSNNQNRTAVAKYIISYLDGARTIYNLTFTYLGIINEPDYDHIPIADIAQYTIILRQMLDMSLVYKNIKLIAGDVRYWQIAEELLSNHLYSTAVSVLSTHYAGPVEVSDKIARLTGKTMWSSEDYSTTDNYNGAACLARIINRNYVQGNMTSTIVWNMIASYYDKLPFPNDGLFTADQPWFGHYDLNPPLWVMAHTTVFTQRGWLYIDLSNHGNLINGGTIVALTNPSHAELTIVIETMTHKISRCVRPHIMNYNLTASNIVIQLSDQLTKSIHQLYRWNSFISKESSTMLVDGGIIQGILGRFEIGLVQPNTLITLSTVKYAGKPKQNIPPSTPFPLTYEVFFNKYAPNTEPDYLTPQAGYFEVNKEGQLEQVMRQPAVEFCRIRFGANHPPPITLMRSNLTRYKTGYSLSVSGAYLSKQSHSHGQGFFLASYVERGGCQVYDTKGFFFVANISTSTSQENCAFHDSFRFSSESAVNISQCQVTLGQSYTLTMQVDSRAMVSLLVDNTLIFMFQKKMYPRDGFFGFGCTVYDKCTFDRFTIRPLV